MLIIVSHASMKNGAGVSTVVPGKEGWHGFPSPFLRGKGRGMLSFAKEWFSFPSDPESVSFAEGEFAKE